MNDETNPIRLARFWSKVDVRGPKQCWPWRATVNDSGYGCFWDGTRLVRAHRFAYEVAVGELGDAVVDHQCHNASPCTESPCQHRRCCNPAHLEAVTQAINSQRGRTGSHNATKTHCRNGHAFTEENTVYPLRPGGKRGERVCRECRRASSLKYNRKARHGE